MWEAAIGVIIGYAFALWWVRLETGKEIDAVGEAFAARLEARELELGRLRDNFDSSQRALAAYDRRNRYLEDALTTSLSGVSRK